MNTFVIEKFSDEASKCVFYSVRWDDQEISETQKFIEKFEGDEYLNEALGQLAKFIQVVIGEEHGALKDFFRNEEGALAIPPNYKQSSFYELDFYRDFPLRLYCMRLSDKIVILFNGDRKTSQEAREGQTRKTFNEANNFARQIDKAINDGMFKISDVNEMELISCDDTDEIIISY